MTAWIKNVPSGDARNQLNLIITQKAGEIMVQESTKAYNNNGLPLVSIRTQCRTPQLRIWLEKIRGTYNTLLPCLNLLLSTLLTAQNDYEKKKGVKNLGKHDMAGKIVFVIISMLLFFRNRATNAFQILIGIFLSFVKKSNCAGVLFMTTSTLPFKKPHSSTQQLSK
ncbi:hypothetical protein B0H34DRAFT_675048 [Crassisporium funariophilum]|nr:hypothetical protein B0H34DRAFT_675048 [Crassisporium funariophilum]